MTRRTERVGNVIQREIADFISRELSDPRLGFLTLSKVEVAPDLSQARISVSVLGNDREKHDTLAALADNAGRIRTHLAKTMSTRTVPHLRFELDRNLDHGMRIAELLKDLDTGSAEKND